jgi:hypothetical protein
MSTLTPFRGGASAIGPQSIPVQGLVREITFRIVNGQFSGAGRRWLHNP